MTQILAIMTLGQKRDVNKLINSGAIQILLTEVQTNPHLDVISNCILSLGNIAAQEDSDFRKKIFQAHPEIFKDLCDASDELSSKNHLRLQ